MKSTLSKIWFALRVNIECSWCQKTMRRALFWNRKRSHSICQRCLRNEKLKLIKPIIGQLDEPETPFVVLNLKSK